MITHAGHNNTRVFRETAALGAELEKIGQAFLEGRVKARVGMILDWNNWWALELSSGPSQDMDYLKTFSKYYKPFYEKNIPVDVLSTESSLEGYSVIVAPMLYMMKDGIAEKLQKFVEQGGTLLTTVMSGLADENDRCIFGEYPGPLKDILGIWVEETDALRPEEQNIIKIKDGGESGMTFGRESYSCGFLCDIIHLRGARGLASYGEDFYAGSPCVTRNEYGKGRSYYVGTQPEDDFLLELTGLIAEEAGIEPLYPAAAGVELTARENERGCVVFAINNNEESAWVDFGDERLENLMTGEAVTGRTMLAPRDVIVAKINKDN